MTARRRAEFVENDLAALRAVLHGPQGPLRELNRAEELRFTSGWRVRRLASKYLPTRVKSFVKGLR